VTIRSKARPLETLAQERRARADIANGRPGIADDDARHGGALELDLAVARVHVHGNERNPVLRN